MRIGTVTIVVAIAARCVIKKNFTQDTIISSKRNKIIPELNQ
jgi:hypothetical protein